MRMLLLLLLLPCDVVLECLDTGALSSQQNYALHATTYDN
jgi:hypothetical protein